MLKHANGSVESRKGNRAWRDHNPGNIEVPKGAKRSFAAQHGAIGQEDVYAVFPDDTAGRNALHDLLKTDTYQNKTIGQAMQMYAPAKDHNDPVAYANALAKHVGVPVDTRVGDLNEGQLSGLMDRIGGVEGFTKKGVSTLIDPPGGSR